MANDSGSDERSCGTCVNYDVIVSNKKPTNHGWCAQLSVYPAVEQEGQVFPSGVKRARRGELARPVIHRPEDVVVACPGYRRR